MICNVVNTFLLFSALFGKLVADEVLPKPPVDGLFFYETFDEDPFASGKWQKSLDEKYVDQPITITAGKLPPKGYEGDKGLQLSKEMKNYGFSAKFSEPLSLKNQKEIVVQYELRLEDTLACGGAYVKLPRLTDGLDLAQLNSLTPYTIMFGPDKCGSSNNKVHFILQHLNPLTSEYEEKHSNDTATVKMDKKTHLYTLQLKSDNTFEVYVDKKSAKKGSLLTHMKPPVNPPKEIDDPEDTKPTDWVEETKIDDPNAKKPDDWDEAAPRQIPDPKAVKPAGWHDDAPKKIPNPDATKPEDWDDEEDGEWEAPLINNPDCDVGCGVWTAPLVKNPAYKGKWKAPRIDNPAYKGPWIPRKIENKNWYYDPNPATDIAPMAGLAVEVWTTNGGILFDNFVVSYSLDAAFKFADATFVLKSEIEGKKNKKDVKEKPNKKDKDDKSKKANKGTIPKGKKAAEPEPEDLVGKVLKLLDDLVESVKENPWPAIATVLAALLVLVLLAPPSKPAPAPRPKSTAAAAVPAPAAAPADAPAAAPVEGK